MPTLMERQLDPNAAYLLQKAIEKRGIEVLTGANTNAILGDGKVEAVRLAGRPHLAGRSRRDGGRHPPQHGARQGSGARGQARPRGRRLSAHQRREHLRRRRMRRASRPVLRPGRAAVRDGEDARRPRSPASRSRGYAGSATSTKLKVTGVDLFSAGDFAEGDEKDEIVLRDPSRGVYKRVVLRDNRIVGAVLYGDTADGSWYFDLLKKSADVTSMRDTLIFGQAYQGGVRRSIRWRRSRRCRTTRKSAAATASARARSRRRSPPRA